jgi:phosphatidylglycerol:prolipoprotein diacylglycerol transferase
MQNFLEIWQNTPSYFDPEIFQWGWFSLRWYSLGYLMGFLTVFLLLYYRFKKREWKNVLTFSSNLDFKKDKKVPRSEERVFDLIFNLFLISGLGLLLGARIGYFFFYDWQNLASQPASIFIPSQSGGYFGMSFHGGVLGALLSSYLYCKIKKINFLEIADFFLPAIGAGYFWGRLGNFFNKELYGKATEMPWGMRFNSSSLHHPTQLYEAFLEGILIFLILWPLRNKKFMRHKFLGFYLILYSFFRFLIEFLRQTPENHMLWNTVTQGQFLSIVAALAGLYFLLPTQKTKSKKT